MKHPREVSAKAHQSGVSTVHERELLLAILDMLILIEDKVNR